MKKIGKIWSALNSYYRTYSVITSLVEPSFCALLINKAREKETNNESYYFILRLI